MLVERKSIMVDHEEKRLKTECKVRLCYLWIANHFLKITSWNYSKFHRNLQSNSFWWLNFFPSKLLYMLRPLVNQTHKWTKCPHRSPWVQIKHLIFLSKIITTITNFENNFFKVPERQYPKVEKVQVCKIYQGLYAQDYQLTDSLYLLIQLRFAHSIQFLILISHSKILWSNCSSYCMMSVLNFIVLNGFSLQMHAENSF